jgi:3,4-dihydroxy 2-butanone 4-phosphate synthase/GTP cyclohydrolase II
MARGPELCRFAAEHDLQVVSIVDLIAYRQRSERQVRRVTQTALPTEHGRFRAIGYQGVYDGAEHVVLVAGNLGDREEIPVYVHTECLSGDVLSSLACTCGPRLNAALRAMSAAGRGIVIYVRPAGTAQACGLLAPTDGAVIAAAGEVAASILEDLAVRSVRLLYENADLYATLRNYGLLLEATRRLHAVAG